MLLTPPLSGCVTLANLLPPLSLIPPEWKALGLETGEVQHPQVKVCDAEEGPVDTHSLLPVLRGSASV